MSVPAAEREDAWRLLSRATFGATRDELERVLTIGRDAWLEEQLDPTSIDDAELDAALAPFDWLAHSAARLRADHPGGGWSLSRDSRAVRLLRAQLSRRQLLERVVELWTDRFNVPFSAQDANFLRPVFDHSAVRANAMRTFPALFRAAVTSPAMLAYLDADESSAGAPNENFARELMELHSVGSDGGYGERDVRDAARCFTGWSYVRHWQAGEFGTFRFDAGRHDQGAKEVLGLSIPAGGGQADGDAVVTHLAHHPATARSVARALARWFVAYEPEPWLLGALESTYHQTSGDIRALLRVVLSRDALASAAPKVKRPFDFAASLMRVTRAAITDPATAVSAIEGLGQPSFAWITPDGYPDEAEAWGSFLFPRWGWTASVTTGWNSWCGLRLIDMQELVSHAPRAEWPERVGELFFGSPAGSVVDELRAYAASVPNPTPGDLAELFELSASSPDFQKY